MLIVLGGLPGVGKTSVARALALKLRAIHLRIDTIEQAVLEANVPPDDDIGPVGYIVASRIATDNLRLGHTVIGDAVNSIEETRAGWRRAAERAGSPITEIELICSDSGEHRRRVETRLSDIETLDLPDWAKVVARHYEPWGRADLTIDTCVSSIEDAAQQIADFVNTRSGPRDV